MIITAAEVRTGDIVVDDGVRHLVTEIRRPTGGAWPVACDGAGWAIALGEQSLEIHVDREAPRGERRGQHADDRGRRSAA